ncbi:MAG: hypothetical protein AB7E52_07050, partial [Bdellovibrionales bacterium]
MPLSPHLSLVIPSYEKHATSFACLMKSLDTYCTDVEKVELVLIIERANQPLFEPILASHSRIRSQVIFTEDVLSRFGTHETPGAFLQRIGKFTFQSTKKLGGILASTAAWSLVLDSESEFVKPFSAQELLENYAQQKYIFYSQTACRGERWKTGLSSLITGNCVKALGGGEEDRWFLEYFHWFYEKEKVVDLLENKVTSFFTDCFTDPTISQRDFFENVLYYIYLSRNASEEYRFYDIVAVLKDIFPPEVLTRFEIAIKSGLWDVGGLEYILNILQVDELHLLKPLFEKFKLPFIRFEPPVFSRSYLEALDQLPYFCALTASHRLFWSRKKLAVCLSGEFRCVRDNLRQVQAFLQGVDCDIFLHGWSNENEALVVRELNPTAYLFEPRKDFTALAERIALPERNIKPQRDQGSLSMFYGMHQTLELLKPHMDDYDFVLRLRPDLFFEKGLYELLIEIGEQGDFPDKMIYVPPTYHSQGINDQIALGSTQEMSTYLSVYSYVEKNIDLLYFNPEYLLLSNLLSHGVRIGLFDLPYALLRHAPVTIHALACAQKEQSMCWWAAPVSAPFYRDVTGFCGDRLDRMTRFVKAGCKEKTLGYWLCVLLRQTYYPFVSNRILLSGIFSRVMFRLYRLARFVVRTPVIARRAYAVYKRMKRRPSVAEVWQWVVNQTYR